MNRQAALHNARLMAALRKAHVLLATGEDDWVKAELARIEKRLRELDEEEVQLEVKEEKEKAQAEEQEEEQEEPSLETLPPALDEDVSEPEPAPEKKPAKTTQQSAAQTKQATPKGTSAVDRVLQKVGSLLKRLKAPKKELDLYESLREGLKNRIQAPSSDNDIAKMLQEVDSVQRSVQQEGPPDPEEMRRLEEKALEALERLRSQASQPRVMETQLARTSREQERAQKAAQKAQEKVAEELALELQQDYEATLPAPQKSVPAPVELGAHFDDLVSYVRASVRQQPERRGGHPRPAARCRPVRLQRTT